MSQDLDSYFQNPFNEDDDLNISLSNDNIELSLNFNSPNNIPLNFGNIFTQPTLTFPPNSNIGSPFQNNENRGNIKKEDKKKLGRKKKDSTSKGLHTKYSSDNIIRKIKTLIIELIFNKIKIEINKAYNGKFSKSIDKKKLLKINKKDILKSGNKEFLNQTLNEIFSNDISSKYKIPPYQASHNKNLIIDLLKEKDEKKRKKFNDLFKLTFLDCLKHFRESKNLKELEGLTTLKNVLNNFEKDPEYVQLFNHYVKNFEEEIERIKEKKKEKNEIL